MTEGDHHTHSELAKQLREAIKGLRADVEARGDTMLEELAQALDLVLDLTTHAHDHAMENRERIEALERRLSST